MASQRFRKEMSLMKKHGVVIGDKHHTVSYSLVCDLNSMWQVVEDCSLTGRPCPMCECARESMPDMHSKSPDRQIQCLFPEIDFENISFDILHSDLRVVSFMCNDLIDLAKREGGTERILLFGRAPISAISGPTTTTQGI